MIHWVLGGLGAIKQTSYWKYGNISFVRCDILHLHVISRSILFKMTLQPQHFLFVIKEIIFHLNSS